MTSKKRVILERAAALHGFPGQEIPACTPAELAQARQIATGVVFFYKTQPVQVGLRDIDWSGGHIPHQEWRAQLNRFKYLWPLASAYQATNDERYAQAARAYMADWMARGGSYESPEAVLRPGDSTLNMSSRLGHSIVPGWAGTLPVFLGSPAFDDAFVEQVLASISSQAGFLARHLTQRASNWRIAELDALVFTALRFPFLENAGPLLKTGITGMRNALATQFLADGVHLERTPGYHDWMTDVAVCYEEIARRFPEADARVNPVIVDRALEYAAQTTLFGVNDSTAPQRDSDRPLENNATRAPGLRAKRALSRPARAPADQVFPNAGHVFARSGGEAGADYLAFDAGTWGGNHGHLSRLSLVLRAGGRVLVADPGILTYEMSNPLAAYGKSTPAHSTLNINGWNQSEADAQLRRAEFTPRTALIQARYQGGYWPGPYTWSWKEGRGSGAFGIHERMAFWVRGEYLLVLDAMASESGADIRNVWQLGPMERWRMDPANLAWWSENADVNLYLQLAQAPPGATMACREGSREPLAGWVGWNNTDGLPAPRVEFRYNGPDSGRATSAVLLCPFRGAARPAFSIEATQAGSVQSLQIQLPDGSRDLVSWTPDLMQPVDDGRPFVTEAPFVWLRLDPAREPAECFVLDGSYLDWEGRRVWERR